MESPAFSTSISQLPRSFNASSTSSSSLNATSSLLRQTKSSVHDSNPFALPDGNSVYMAREKERQRELAAKERFRESDMWTRTQMQTAKQSKIKPVDIDQVLPSAYQRAHSHAALAAVMSSPPVKSTTPRASRGRTAPLVSPTPARVASEPLQEFITKKREMFLVQMSLENKEQEIDRLEADVRQKHEKLATVEMTLESDALRFDKFLKENDRIAHEAMKRQEQMTREKIEASADIRRLQSELTKIDLEIGKLQETLSDSVKYKSFLDSITPADHVAAQRAEREAREATRRARTADASAGAFDDSSDEVVEVDEPFFTAPQQLMEELARIEERNLFLIQNCQATEEAIEQLRQKFDSSSTSLTRQTDQTRGSIEELRKRMADENQRTQKLSARVSVGYFSSFSEQAYRVVHDSVVAAFSALKLFDDDADPVLVLREVEKRIDAMSAEWRIVDPEFRAQAEKVKDAERRERQRAERLEQQRLHDEERIRKSRARAIMAGELAMKAKLKPQMFKTVLRKKESGAASATSGAAEGEPDADAKRFFEV